VDPPRSSDRPVLDLGSINIVVTILNMRAPGMGRVRLPLFCWSVWAQRVMLIVALPANAAAVTMQLTDRHFETCFFDPTCGGSALLYQHLFWFFGHPEVYIMILPGFGVISEVLPVFARKPIFGYKTIAASTAGIAFTSMSVWAHHMFATPTAPVMLAVLMITSMLVAIPTGSRSSTGSPPCGVGRSSARRRSTSRLASSRFSPWAESLA
jgi:heme/copper-type cytochrome/quinol oxidase subunit 1